MIFSSSLSEYNTYLAYFIANHGWHFASESFSVLPSHKKHLIMGFGGSWGQRYLGFLRRHDWRSCSGKRSSLAKDFSAMTLARTWMD
jgi:hypothetical protein